MLRLSYCLLLVLLAPTCLGDQKAFWVLGSYSNKSNADREQARLTDKLAVEVSILETDQGFYRVVVSAERIGKQDVSDLDPWLLSTGESVVIEPVDRTPNPAPESETLPLPRAVPELTTKYRVSDSEQDDPPLIIEEPPSEPLYPAFNSGESISQYCVRLPDSRLCQHPGIKKAIEDDKKLLKLRGEIEDACEIVTDPDWRETCLSLHPASQ